MRVRRGAGVQPVMPPAMNAMRMRCSATAASASVPAWAPPPPLHLDSMKHELQEQIRPSLRLSVSPSLPSSLALQCSATIFDFLLKRYGGSL